MAGSSNRLLAKAPKRRLQRRGGAWQEGDFLLSRMFRKKKLNRIRRGGRKFELVDFKVPLLPHGLDRRAVVGRRCFGQTKHARAWNSCSISRLRRDFLLGSPSLPFVLCFLASIRLLLFFLGARAHILRFRICDVLPPSHLFENSGVDIGQYSWRPLNMCGR